MVNARFVRPLDGALLSELAGRHHRHCMTLEEHSLEGGFGSAVLDSSRTTALQVSVSASASPAVLVQAGKQPEQRASFGLTGENWPPGSRPLQRPPRVLR